MGAVRTRPGKSLEDRADLPTQVDDAGNRPSRWARDHMLAVLLAAATRPIQAIERLTAVDAEENTNWELPSRRSFFTTSS